MIKVKGNRIYLKELREKDATPVYCSWLNDKEVNRYLETKKIKIKELKFYIKEKIENPNCIFFGIFTKKKNKHVGNVKLEPIIWKEKKATLGIMIGDKNYWGKGIAKEVLEIFTGWLFKNTNIETVYLGVLKENKAAISAYKKAGFKFFKKNNKALKMQISRKNKFAKLKSNEKISRLGLGTVQFGLDYGFSKAKTYNEVNKVLSFCIRNGINFLDTARDYGESEKKTGHFLKKNKARDKFFIATKLSKIDRLVAINKKTLEKVIIKSTNNSLRELNIESIDLLQLHQEDKFLLNNKNFWKIISKLKKRGYIKSFGLSVYGVDILKKVIQQKKDYIDFVQLPYNVFDRRFEKLFAGIRKNDIQIICRSVFLKGIITARNEDIPEELKNLLPYKKEIQRIAKKHNFSVSELCLLFVLSNSSILTAIIGVDSSKELEENAKAIDKLERFKKTALKELKKIKIKNKFLIDPRRWKNF